MANTSTTEQIHPAERVFSPPAIVAAVFLGLHILPLFWRPVPMWGFDFLYYMPIWVQVAFVLLAVIPFVPRFQRLCRTCVTSLPFALWGKGRRVWVSRALILILAFVAFVSLSSASHLLGDGYGVLIKLEGGNWPDRYRAPLVYAIVEAMYRAGSSLWLSAENTYRIYSYISGILFVLLAFPVADMIGKTDRDKSVALAFVCSAGYMQLFFGYVENYALLVPGLLLYILVGLQTWRQRLPLYVSAIVLGILLALHPVNVVLGPSLFFLSYHTYNNRRDRVTHWKNITATAASLCCGPASAVLFLWLSGISVDAYMGASGADDFLPVFAEPGFLEQYRVFSHAHFVDFINQQLLAAPAAIMILFLLRIKDLRYQPFLAVCTFVPLFFTFIANPRIGAFRDWDIFAMAALPLTLWSATTFLNRARYPARIFHGAFVICCAAALHTLLWIGVNANGGSAEARFVRQAARLDKNAGSYGWGTLGSHYGSQGKYDLALNAYKRAIEASPEHPWHYLSLARIYRGLGQEQPALDNVRRTLEIRPDLPQAHTTLGSIHLRAGRDSLAINHLRKAVELQPDVAVSHLNLGAGFGKVGKLDSAIVHLQAAVKIQSGLATAHENLGVIYWKIGRLSDAIDSLERAIALQPQNAASRAHLGAAYRDAGRYDEAVEQLSSAIALQPDRLVAYVDLGFIYKSQSRYALAVEQFEKAIELQGDQANAMAYLNIGDTYYQMREYDEAIPYFRKAIQLNPNDVHAHLLLGLSYRALDRDDQARIYFEKTLEMEPDHLQAAKIRQWLGQIRE